MLGRLQRLLIALYWQWCGQSRHALSRPLDLGPPRSLVHQTTLGVDELQVVHHKSDAVIYLFVFVHLPSWIADLIDILRISIAERYLLVSCPSSVWCLLISQRCSQYLPELLWTFEANFHTGKTILNIRSNYMVFTVGPWRMNNAAVPYSGLYSGTF